MKYLFFLLALTTTAYSQETNMMSGPSGTYTVITPDLTKITWGNGWVMFQWLPGPGPDPGPSPNPGPVPPNPVPPPPIPTPKAVNKLHITLIYDSNVDQGTISIRNKLSTTDFKAYNAIFRSYSTAQKELLEKFLLTPFTKKLPCVIVQEEANDGKTAPLRPDGTFENVKNADTVINYIKSLR